MKPAAFKKSVQAALEHAGFSRLRDLSLMDGDGVRILVAAAKGFGDQYFVNVGFHLMRGHETLPVRVEKCHLYFRLERLFPQHRDLILAAGDLQAPDQAVALPEFLARLKDEFGRDLHTLGSEATLRAAFREGRLTHGLVTKEGKALLADMSH